MNKIISITLILIILSLKGYSQINYSGKIEIGYLGFQNTMFNVDPGPNWNGYNLDSEQNGIDINMVNGVGFNNKFFIGLGLGYLNFEGINGFSIFTDFEYLPLKTKLTPLINLKIGYNHIWNQYEHGTGGLLVEFGSGISYKLTEKLNVYLQSGLSITQQTFFIPLRLGLKF